jgi:hypothetical protein
MLVVASLFTAVTTTVADQPDDIPLIGFDFDNGFSTNQTTVISGSIEDEVKPASVTWSIVASEPYLVELDSGDFSDILEASDSSGSRPIWTWSLEIDVAEHSPCTCYLTVTVETASEGFTQSHRVLFLGDTSRSAIIVDSPEPGDWVHGFISVSGWSMYPMTWTTPELRLFAKPASSSIDACSTEADSDMSAHLSIIIPDGEFSESLDISGLEDGWHSLYAENYDPSGVTYSQECVPIQVNNLAPSISIEGPDHSLEGASDLFFDASATDDPVWGREELHYMWVLRKPSHSGQTPLQIVMGQDKGTMAIPTGSSGDYTLTLVVTDAGGISSTMVKIFTIQNVVPKAIASLDDSSIEDGSRIKLSPGSEWMLDASLSEDSENDQSGLRCVWKIDHQPVYEGCIRALSWPPDAGDEVILTLDVIDDDDDYGSISVLLVHPEAAEPLPYSLIVLVISTLFMLSAIMLRYRSSDDSSSIPKWKSDE